MNLYPLTAASAAVRRFSQCATSLAGVCLLSLAQAQSMSMVRINTMDGPVAGVRTGSVEAFKGIPYARAPVGPLRWRKPEPATHWTAVREASDFGASCEQARVPTYIKADSGAQVLSEDCLTLNVWAPVGVSKAAVMVWVHGGGNTEGSSADFFMDGQNFARDGVIVVSMNYRLGVFGFFTHPDLKQSGRPVANFGLWDQLMALHWVQSNITRFGGDPANVTLFGESAGGQDILALMTSAASRGLFAKAIVQSPGGGWGPESSLAQAQPAAASSASSVPTASLEQLRQQPVAALLKLNPKIAGPVIDDDLLRAAVLSVFSQHRALAIPLMVGTNNQEGSLLGNAAVDPAGIWPSLRAADLSDLRAAYGASAADDTKFAKNLFRDGYFTGPVRLVARSTGAYLYRFSYVLSPLQRRRSGAWHGSEIPFEFERWPIDDLNDTDRRVEAAIHNCWLAFARIGIPHCAGAEDWQPLNASGKEMRFDDQPSPRTPDDQSAIDILERRLSPLSGRPP